MWHDETGPKKRGPADIILFDICHDIDTNDYPLAHFACISKRPVPGWGEDR